MERDRDWRRLARAFAEARRAIGLTQEEAAAELHVSRGPIQAIERGRQSNGKDFTKVTGTMRAYARLVRWTEDSIDRVLDGGDPQQEEAPPPPVTPTDPASDLPLAVAMELRSGRTLDSTVVHIGPEESDARIIVVLKGNPDITEEQVEELMRDWRKQRRHLQGVATETDATPDR